MYCFDSQIQFCDITVTGFQVSRFPSFGKKLTETRNLKCIVTDVVLTHLILRPS